MSTRGRRTTARPSATSCQIPIVDSSLRIVGWTVQPPAVISGELRHPEAEKLVGGPIEPVYVELTSRPESMLAGAPANWHGPWRCLALAHQRKTRATPREKQPAPADRTVPPPLRVFNGRPTS